jgi:excisionase family DNA binding protein
MARDDTMTVGEARELLGVGKQKMAKLTRAGGPLPTTPDALDGRIKLVRRADVEQLLAQSAKKGSLAQEMVA